MEPNCLVHVTAELAAEQLRTEVFYAAVESQDVEPALQRDDLDTDDVLEVPDLCNAFNGANLNVPVAGSSVPCTLEAEPVREYPAAHEAALEHKLLVELKDGGEHTIPAVGRVSHELGYATIKCEHGEQVCHIDAEGWPQEDRPSDVQLRPTHTLPNRPLPGDARSITMPTTVGTSVDQGGSNLALNELPGRTITADGCRELLWKVLQQVTNRREVARAQDLYAGIITAASDAHFNIVVRQPTDESEVKLKTIPLPNGAEQTVKKTFDQLRRMWHKRDPSMKVPTDKLVAAILKSRNQRWAHEGLEELRLIPDEMDRNHLLPEDPVQKADWIRICEELIESLCNELQGQWIGFLVLSNSVKPHLIGVTPSVSRFGRLGHSSLEAAEGLANALHNHGEQNWIVLHRSPAGGRVFYPSREGRNDVPFSVLPAG